MPTAAPNVGREIVLDLGLPASVEAMTVTRACASGLQAVTIAAATESAPAKPVRPAGERRASLGTMPDFAHPGPGVRVEAVRPGSPAESAGIRAGDQVVEIDGEIEIAGDGLDILPTAEFRFNGAEIGHRKAVIRAPREKGQDVNHAERFVQVLVQETNPKSSLAVLRGKFERRRSRIRNRPLAGSPSQKIRLRAPISNKSGGRAASRCGFDPDQSPVCVSPKR